MKILLASPNTNRPVYNQAGQLPQLTGICPPLGIGYLASSLMLDGHEVVLYDWVGCDSAQIESNIRSESPEVVGVSCFTLTRGAALDVARIAKKVNTQIHVVFGGSHASALPRQILEHYREVDAVVIGEGEEILRQWVQELSERGNSVPAGVMARRDGETLSGGERSFIKDLDALPYPVRSLQNTPPYRPFPERCKPGTQASFIASRGCPYRCQFCSTTVYWGSRYRMRSVANVVDEMQYLIEEGRIEDIEILDDAFTARKSWTLDLCSEIRKRGLRFDWAATTRANYVDEELCVAMRRAGCSRLILGIESFSDRILNSIHKGISSAQAVEAVQTVKKAGLHVCCLLMVGNPGDTWETIKENAVALRTARPHEVLVNPTQVYPQTELYEIAKQGGLVSDDYWLEETRGAPIFTLENTVEDLQKFAEAINDTQWSSQWHVKAYRALGLRKVGRWVRGNTFFWHLKQQIGLRGALAYLTTDRIRNDAEAQPYQLYAAGLEHPLLCRPSSSDRSVFSQVFIDRQYACVPDLAERALIVDCGANVGYSAAYFISRFPGAHLVAVEPDPGSSRLLKQNLKVYGEQVKIKQAAIWPKPAHLKVVAGDDAWRTMVRPCDPEEQSDVNGIDIASILSESGHEEIDLLKIDIEGAEEVLFSQNTEPWKDRVKVCVAELHDEDCRAAFAVCFPAEKFAVSEHGELTMAVRRRR